jgi:hypothetical protein
MHNLTREELIRRITFISEDINKIYDRLQDMNVDTGTNKQGVSLDTYASNIMVVCDMDKDGNVDEDGHRVEDEWLSIDERNERNWDARKKPFDEIVETLKELDVDGEMMQYIIEGVHMDDQMLRQLIMTLPTIDSEALIKERKVVNP